jgi:drug/metabolite transporter (DMT)-like permease
VSAFATTPARRSRALMALLSVTILWGCTFVWMKQSLNAAERSLGHPGGAPVVALYLGLRFGLAALILAFWPRARRGLDRGAWRGGAILGVLLFAGFLFQMVGLEGVSPPVSAFLTSLYVVFAAIFAAWMRRARPHLALLAGVALATFGAGFIEGPPHLTFGRAEWLTVVCAFIFALHILATDRITKAHAPVPVTLAMFVWTAGLGAAALPITMLRAGAPSAADLVNLLREPAFSTPLVLATLFATVLALTLMNQFQRELDPVRAAILFSLEPVWTTLIAMIAGFGRPSVWLWIGGGALVAGNLIAEWGVGTGTGTCPQ